jgi:hypothetical protein
MARLEVLSLAVVVLLALSFADARGTLYANQIEPSSQATVTVGKLSSTNFVANSVTTRMSLALCLSVSLHLLPKVLRFCDRAIISQVIRSRARFIPALLPLIQEASFFYFELVLPPSPLVAGLHD